MSIKYAMLAWLSFDISATHVAGQMIFTVPRIFYNRDLGLPSSHCLHRLILVVTAVGPAPAAEMTATTTRFLAGHRFAVFLDVVRPGPLNSRLLRTVFGPPASLRRGSSVCTMQM
mmetsp:Transcript_76489/g.175321  ORF Transcript_76489/g.175321 Transcript_76489/m.175321 type:complete len:115 (+) Transcript_76489:1109-1453(+)